MLDQVYLTPANKSLSGQPISGLLSLGKLGYLIQYPVKTEAYVQNTLKP